MGLSQIGSFPHSLDNQNDHLTRYSPVNAHSAMSLGPHDDPGVQVRDASPEGYWWIKDDCESKWRIVSRKRATFIALAFFLVLDSSQRKAYGLRARSAYHGDKGLIQLLIDQGAHAVADNERFNEALQAAAYGGYEEMIRPLVEQCADVNAQGGKYGNALLAAVEGGYENIVQLLIDYGGDVNARDEVYGNALHAAAYEGLDKIVQLLLERGADFKARDSGNNTTLQLAVSRGHDQIVEQLLVYGANVYTRGRELRTTLQAALSKGHAKIMKRLLQRQDEGKYKTSPSYDSKADVHIKNPADTPKQPRKFADGKKIRKKNAHDILEWEVHVVSARYDEEGQEWMYILTDWEKKAMAGETEETRLG